MKPSARAVHFRGPSGRSVMRWGGVLFLLGLRLLWLSAYPLNSDEPQHAHVAWSLAQGAMAYRDVFDNHGPLFSTMYAALLQVVGERPDILWWLRLAVVPWYLLALVATWSIARRLHPRGVADATVLLVGLFPIVFLKSGEFRTDDAWAALWLSGLAVAVLVRGRASGWFCSGLLFGAALSVSQKTLPLAIVALASAAAIWLPSWWQHRRLASVNAFALLAGALVIPGAFVLWLVLQHDAAPAWYDIVAYNMAPTGHAEPHWRLVGYLVLAMAMIGGTIVHARRVDALARWRVFFAVHALLFMLLIWFVWPLPTEQDFLPVVPTAMLCVVGFVARSSVLPPRGTVVFVAVIAAAELSLLIVHAPPWRNTLAADEAQLRVVLDCTISSDTLMDAKSGDIFRRRPYYLVIESLARERFESGRLPDDIAGWLVANHTMAAIDGRYPPAAQAFIARNYRLGTAGVRMAGLVLPATSSRQRFTLALAGDYVVTDGQREVPVSIDAKPDSTARWLLAAGPHTLDATGKPLLIVWRQAWDCGWRPLARS